MAFRDSEHVIEIKCQGRLRRGRVAKAITGPNENPGNQDAAGCNACGGHETISAGSRSPPQDGPRLGQYNSKKKRQPQERNRENTGHLHAECSSKHDRHQQTVRKRRPFPRQPNRCHHQQQRECNGNIAFNQGRMSKKIRIKAKGGGGNNGGGGSAQVPCPPGNAGPQRLRRAATFAAWLPSKLQPRRCLALNRKPA